jgi:hypothetical protein
MQPMEAGRALLADWINTHTAEQNRRIGHAKDASWF